MGNSGWGEPKGPSTILLIVKAGERLARAATTIYKCDGNPSPRQLDELDHALHGWSVEMSRVR